jgi:hypothetical protein
MLASSVWRGRSHWWFSAGLLVGGLTGAVVVVAIGSLVLRPFLPTVAAVALAVVIFALVAANELGILTLRLPQNGRQVPQGIVEDGGQYGALQFGFEMGTGVRTFMTSGLPHVLAALVLLVASWPAAVVTGLGFGAGRAWMTLSRTAHPDEAAWDTSLTKLDRTIRVTLTVVAAMSISALVRTTL